VASVLRGQRLDADPGEISSKTITRLDDCTLDICAVSAAAPLFCRSDGCIPEEIGISIGMLFDEIKRIVFDPVRFSPDLATNEDSRARPSAAARLHSIINIWRSV